MNISGFRLHPLKGGNAWPLGNLGQRQLALTFEFREGNAYILNYEDYH